MTHWEGFQGRLAAVGMLVVVCGAATLAAAEHSAVLPRAPRFIAERIDLDLRPGLLQVRGEYVFFCQGVAEEFPIFCPFPCDDEFGPAELLDATVSWGGAAEQTLAVFCAPDGCHFVLPSAPHDTCTVRLAYRQILSGSRALYILESTRAWHAPLDRAEFHLTVAREIAERLRVNYPFRPGLERRDALTFEFIARRILPDRDLELRF